MQCSLTKVYQLEFQPDRQFYHNDCRRRYNQINDLIFSIFTSCIIVTSKNTNLPDWISDCHGNNIFKVSGYTNLSQNYPSMPWYLQNSQYLDCFFESNSGNVDVILPVIITATDVLPLYYVTWDNRRGDAHRCEQLHVNVSIATYLNVINTEGNYIVNRNGDRW